MFFDPQEGSVKEWKDMLDVNVVGLTQTTQLAIKSMLKVKISHFCEITLEDLFVNLQFVNGEQIFIFLA